MKRILKHALLLAIFTATITLPSCTLHDEQWQECIPLPETEIPVEPEPWEPGDTGQEFMRGDLFDANGGYT